jgi:hypothetical protein
MSLRPEPALTCNANPGSVSEEIARSVPCSPEAISNHLFDAGVWELAPSAGEHVSIGFEYAGNAAPRDTNRPPTIHHRTIMKVRAMPLGPLFRLLFYFICAVPASSQIVPLIVPAGTPRCISGEPALNCNPECFYLALKFFPKSLETRPRAARAASAPDHPNVSDTEVRRPQPDC